MQRINNKQRSAQRGPSTAAAAPADTATGLASTLRPAVKRLSSRPVVIAGAALMFVVLAVAFLVTSRPKPNDANAAAAGFTGAAPDGPAAPEFMNSDPAAPAVPGPACQGMECAAGVAAGQAPVPNGAAVEDSDAATPAAPGADASSPQTDPYAVSYGPPPEAAPPAAPAQQECGRGCRYRTARASRLVNDDGTAASSAATPAASPGTQFRAGADGSMPDAYYSALADSMLRAELSAAAPHSDRNAEHTQLATSPAEGAGRAAAAPSAPRTPYVVPAGTIVSAALVTGINSDLCGAVKAVVTRDVYDAQQRTVLIPAGAELLGSCGDQIAAGQARLAVAWTTLRFPSGRTLALPGMPTHSPNGASGVRDRTNNHWGRVFGTALLLSALGAGTQLGIPQDTDGSTVSPSQTAATAAATELSTLATEILRRNLEVKPTIEIRPATPFVVFVAADLDVGAPATASRTGGARW